MANPAFNMDDPFGDILPQGAGASSGNLQQAERGINFKPPGLPKGRWGEPIQQPKETMVTAQAPELDVTTKTLSQFAEPAGEMVGKAINLPFVPLQYGVEKGFEQIRPVVKPILQQAFPKATEQEINMVLGGVQGVTELALIPSYLKMVNAGGKILAKAGRLGFYKFAPDWMFPKGEAGLPVPLSVDEVMNRLKAMPGKERAEMVKKYPQFRKAAKEIWKQTDTPVPTELSLKVPQTSTAPANQTSTSSEITILYPGSRKSPEPLTIKTYPENYAKQHIPEQAKEFSPKRQEYYKILLGVIKDYPPLKRMLADKALSEKDISNFAIDLSRRIDTVDIPKDEMISDAVTDIYLTKPFGRIIDDYFTNPAELDKLIKGGEYNLAVGKPELPLTKEVIIGRDKISQAKGIESKKLKYIKHEKIKDKNYHVFEIVDPNNIEYGGIVRTEAFPKLPPEIFKSVKSQAEREGLSLSDLVYRYTEPDTGYIFDVINPKHERHESLFVVPFSEAKAPTPPPTPPVPETGVAPREGVEKGTEGQQAATERRVKPGKVKGPREKSPEELEEMAQTQPWDMTEEEYVQASVNRTLRNTGKKPSPEAIKSARKNYQYIREGAIKRGRIQPTSSDTGIKEPWEIYQKAPNKVSGLKVRSEIPNQDSIDATFDADTYKILPGVREVPLADFDSAPDKLFYSADDLQRVKSLAEEIKSSGEISPLIVIMENEGPYILEGGHRLGALHELKATSFPALVVDARTKPDLPSVETATGTEKATPALSPEIEAGRKFETGKPVTFTYLHNKEKSPYMGSRFGQDIEPKGQYVTDNYTEDTYLVDKMPDKYEMGKKTFQNPLVIENSEGEPLSYKNKLVKMYGGKKGKKLTEAILADGYDAVVSKDSSGITREIIDFKPITVPKPDSLSPEILAARDQFAKENKVAPEYLEYKGSTDEGHWFSIKDPEHPQFDSTGLVEMQTEATLNATEITKLKRQIAKQEASLEKQKVKMGAMTPPPIRAEVIGKWEEKIGKLYDKLEALETQSSTSAEKPTLRKIPPGNAVAKVETDTPKIKPIRFEIGKDLTPQQKKTVLKNLGDVYRDAKLEKVIKGEAHGDPIWGYPHTPELFIKSDITGRMIRHYIHLPDGRISHPSELFPEISQSVIDRHIKEAFYEAKRQEKFEKADTESKMRRIASPDDKRGLKNAANENYHKTGRKVEGSYFAQNDEGQIVRVDGKDSNDVNFYKTKGFRPISEPVSSQLRKIPPGERGAVGPDLAKRFKVPKGKWGDPIDTEK